MNTGKALWKYGDGSAVEKIHLTADKYKLLTQNGLDLYYCVDVDSAEGWYEVYEVYEEDESEDYYIE